MIDENWFGRVLAKSRSDGLLAGLIRGGLGSAGVQALTIVFALALGILLARGLGVEGYGTYAYAYAIMGLLMVVAEAGVPTLLMREVAAALGQRRWGLLRGALIRGCQLVLLASVSVSIVGFMVLSSMAHRLNPAVFETTELMLALLPLAALGKTIAGAIRGLHHAVVGQALEMLLRPFLVFAGCGMLFVLVPTLRQPQFAMATQLVAAAVVLLVGGWLLSYHRPDASRVEPVEYRSYQWLRSALPFTLIGGAGIINNQADILMLGWFGDATQVGTYRVAMQGATLAAFGLQAISAVVAPHFAQLYAQGDIDKLQRLAVVSARIALFAALPIVIILVFAGGDILTWVFGAEFASGQLPMAILAIGQLIVAPIGMGGALVSMAGFENVVSKAIWLSALSNIALNFFLIPIFGTAGAAASTAITVSMWNAFLFIFAKKKVNIIVFPVSRLIRRKGE